jgi:hypothetical protein
MPPSNTPNIDVPPNVDASPHLTHPHHHDFLLIGGARRRREEKSEMRYQHPPNASYQPDRMRVQPPGKFVVARRPIGSVSYGRNSAGSAFSAAMPEMRGGEVHEVGGGSQTQMEGEAASEIGGREMYEVQGGGYAERWEAEGRQRYEVLDEGGTGGRWEMGAK